MSGFFIDADISRAQTIKKTFYTEARYYTEAREKIFARSWQFIGDVSMVHSPGACYPVTLLDGLLSEPLILVRDKEGNLHCLSNVCTHRGNLLATEPCTVTHIRCRYHGRIFQLTGEMVSMPEFREVRNFPSGSDNLPRLELFQWGPILFTSLEKEGRAQPFFSDMMERISWLPLNEFRLRADLSKDYYIDAHWALYCENYLEGFHIPFVHAGLNAMIDFGSYTTELFRYSSLQLGIAKTGEDCFDIPETSIDFGKNIAAYYFWVFPNMMFNFYPWGLSVNIVQPISPTRTRTSFITYMWKEEHYKKGAGQDLDKVELEDEAIVQQVQKGIGSRFYDKGRYSVTREQGTHHFHRLIAEFMN